MCEDLSHLAAAVQVCVARLQHYLGRSPLSCNSLAKDLSTNAHCLFTTAEEAAMHLENGDFEESEPGPYRIYASTQSISVNWP
jgi:hypothetical protein